eukprot:maker-scaffold28_size608977-snap-gene-1.16 protein:Tk05742 transcript:maker-scaffold28_size608977-snap-gene-1.16-mRNA-1 annotation:"hypothetical protein DAPPUDRAFT_207420"
MRASAQRAWTERSISLSRSTLNVPLRSPILTGSLNHALESLSHVAGFSSGSSPDCLSCKPNCQGGSLASWGYSVHIDPSVAMAFLVTGLPIWVVLVHILVGQANGNQWFVPGSEKATCGYEGCPEIDPDMINVHLVPHSHDDVGWKKTVDQYYYGDKQSVQRAGIQYILDGVLQELALDPAKKFIQVETAYFWRWWSEQSEDIKTMVKTLVQEGRLEFIGGGWSMNDEATTHYTGLIDNMALGFKEIKDIFGNCGVPRVAWQIDPFGHSKEQANLFAQMGFDGLFFARIDYRDKIQRMANQGMQMVWEGSDDLGEESSIFTGVFTDLYAAPAGFQFDMRYDDDPIVDDPRLREYNLDAKIELFLETVTSNITNYQSQRNLMFTMGGDFNFQIANMNYQNLDKLIKYVNERSAETKIRAFYSTPSCFLKALNDESLTWPSKTDDFFPYADGPNAYWSGYFTSRPAFKFHERQSNGILQAAKQVTAFFGAPNSDELFDLQRALGVAQHHDALTGTNHADVNADYHLRLSEGQFVGQKAMADSIFPLIGQDFDGKTDYTCSHLNVSHCAWTDTEDRLTLTIYNPVPRAMTLLVRLPLADKKSVTVWDGDLELIPEYIPIPTEVLSLEERSASLAVVDAVVQVEDVPALGFKVLHVQQKASNASMAQPLKSQTAEEFQADMPEGFNAQLGHYVANQDVKSQASGAYIFRPAATEAIMSPIVSALKYEGRLLNEWRVQMDVEWGSFLVRKLAARDEYEVEWLVGPIPIDGANGMEQGREVIMRYSKSGVTNAGMFWTDANGRQMIQRERNARSSFDLENGSELEPVASNYYPVTAGIYISDEANQMSVLNDRSQGGSSLKDGDLELMVHRRLLVDDDRGLQEVLNETDSSDNGLIVRGKHFFYKGPVEESTIWRRNKMQEQFLQPVFLFSPTSMTSEQWTASQGLKTWTGINQDQLGDNVHILSLEPWDEGTILLRLEHFFEAKDNVPSSEPVNVALDQIFAEMEVDTFIETTLGANMVLNQSERLHWNTNKWSMDHPATHPLGTQPDDFTITLLPMEIRTFFLTIRQ